MVTARSHSKINRSAAWLACLLGLAACVWSASGLFWQIQTHGNATPVKNLSPVSNRSTRINTPAASQLAQLHLFGNPVAAAQAITINLPETQLALKLLGTLAAEDPQSGFAIIADEQGNEGYYGKDDEIVTGTELYEVYADRVVLTRRGVRESLSLERESDLPQNSGNRTPQRPAINNNRVATVTRPGQSTATTNVNWSAIRQNARMDPIKLAQQIQALPFTENGKQIGVRLRAGRDATLLNRLGLRSSDVIMSVNGVGLDDPTKSFSLISQLNTETQFQVKIRRDGKDMTLNIDLNK